jgi:hypothetical protein
MCNIVNSQKKKKGKNKAVPLTGGEGPQKYERLPHFLYNRFIDGGEFASLTRRLHFSPGKIPGTHFC